MRITARYVGFALLGLVLSHAAAFGQVEMNNVALESLGATAFDNGHLFYNGNEFVPTFAIDGDSTTYWAGLQSHSPQRLTIGFDQRYRIDRIRVGEYYPGGVSYFTNADFEYFDGYGWNALFTEIKSSPGMDRSFPAVYADSLRVLINARVAPASWFNRVACISAVEVNGLPIVEAFNNIALIDLGGTAYDNGSFADYGTDQDAMLAIDGDPATYWAGLQYRTPQTMTIGFDRRYTIDRVRVQENYPGGVSYFTSADFAYFDGDNWLPLFSWSKSEPHMDHTFPAVDADSIRIMVNACVAPGSWYNKVACINAFEVNGEAAAEPFNNVALSSYGSTIYDNGHFDDYIPPRDAPSAIDGDLETYWAGLVYAHPQMLTIGFPHPCEIDRIRIWENYPGGVSYFTDADFEYFDGNDWLPLFNAVKASPDFDRRFPAVVADSVRVFVNACVAPASWYNPVACISEFEVNGRPVGDVYGNAALATLGAEAYDNGYFDDYGPVRDAAKAIDGDPETYWAGLQTRSPQTMTIGFYRSVMINRIRILENYPGGVSYFTDADFDYFDGSAWQSLLHVVKSEPGMDMTFPPVLADSVRIRIHGLVAPGSWYNRVACISEFEVYSNYLADADLPLPAAVAATNFPNPFNPRTTIRLDLPRDSFVDLRVHDLRGRLVRTLLAERVGAGIRDIDWTGDDDRGRRVASGLYFYVVRTEQGVISRKMMMVE